MSNPKRPHRRRPQPGLRDEDFLRADDPRPQRVTQYPVMTGPRRPSQEAIPTSLLDPNQQDEELRASYDADAEHVYKSVFLYVERGPGQGQLVQVRQGQLVIGRASVSDLRLQHPSISRRHAMLIRTGEQFYVRDLGSQNGTFVNHERIAGEVEVRAGDMLSIGNALLKLRFPSLGGEEDGVDDTSSEAASRAKLLTRWQVISLVGGILGLALLTAILISLIRPGAKTEAVNPSAKPVPAEVTPSGSIEVNETRQRLVDEAIKKKMDETAKSGMLRRSQILTPYENGDAQESLVLAQKAQDQTLVDRLDRFIDVEGKAKEAMESGQTSTAMRQLEALLKLDDQLSGGWSKKNTEIRKQLSKLYTRAGLGHVKGGRNDEARVAFQAALKVDSQNSEARVQLDALGDDGSQSTRSTKASAKAADEAFGETPKPSKKPKAAPRTQQAIDDAFGQ